MTTSATSATLIARSTVSSLARRGLAVAMMVALPLTLYALRREATGQSVRALVFGVTWAVSTMAFFSARVARELEPRLRLAGWSTGRLVAGRVGGLVLVGLGVCALFWLVVALDQDVRSIGGVAVDLVVTALVAVAVGTAVGSFLAGELDGALVIFFLAAVQAVVDPAQSVAKALPFWSSREFGTWAIDGPAHASAGAATLHALGTIALCAAVVAFAPRRRAPRAAD